MQVEDIRKTKNNSNKMEKTVCECCVWQRSYSKTHCGLSVCNHICQIKTEKGKEYVKKALVMLISNARGGG